MPTFLYSGVSGSGKTYEVVENVIIPNLALGRDIVTNVAGLNYDEIVLYILENYPDLHADDIGKIKPVTFDQILSDDLLPKEDVELQTSIVQPGDVLIIDECWKIYATGEKPPKSHLLFLRANRHFLHPVTGVSCDFVLIVQDPNDLQRKVRGQIDKSFLMQKHDDMGLDNRYVVQIYKRARFTKADFIQDIQRTYNPKIYSLYKSHSQHKGTAQPKQLGVDKRGNIFNRRILKYGIPFSVFMIGSAVYFTWQFFHPKPKETPPTESKTAELPPSPSPETQRNTLPEPPISNWRLIGRFTRGAFTVYMVSDNDGRVRYITEPPAVKETSGELELALPDGQIATRWTGQPKQTTKSP